MMRIIARKSSIILDNCKNRYYLIIILMKKITIFLSIFVLLPLTACSNITDPIISEDTKLFLKKRNHFLSHFFKLHFYYIVLNGISS